MKTKWFKITIVALVIGVLAVGVAAVNAQRGPGGGVGFGGPEDSLVGIAADTLGMKYTDLVTELRAGKTIADVAKAKGVELDKIVSAFVADRTVDLTAAVKANRLTQAQADAMLATMKTQVTARLSATFSPRGFGLGMMGRDHDRGMGRRGGRFGHGMGMGMGFVDADKDGLCDHCEAATPQTPQGSSS
jgi:hypothetical protein